ncbi:MAG: glycerol-3-phosphate 1-O-acyltransferase PlsY [Oscillospiraceae bacterium]|nr:glycerol-3-phosphate 1-O-acyltransferase PlsY [Oscillospiraceae bacterium]
MQVVYWLAVVVASYFLGNINGALLISRALMKDDVRTHGSGNAGLTNFFRTYGGVQSLLVIVIDVLKCALACLVARWLLPQHGLFAAMVAGAVCIFGHSYPVLEGFRGGKGIMSGFAMALMTDVRVAMLILAVFVLTVVLTRYVSLGSVLAAAAFAVGYLVFHWSDAPVCVVAVLTAAFVIFRHRGNILRLCKGTESKLTFHKK